MFLAHCAETPQHSNSNSSGTVSIQVAAHLLCVLSLSLALIPCFRPLSSYMTGCSFYFQVQRKWNYCALLSVISRFSFSLSVLRLRKWSEHEIDIINTQLKPLQMSFKKGEIQQQRQVFVSPCCFCFRWYIVFFFIFVVVVVVIVGVQRVLNERWCV